MSDFTHLHVHSGYSYQDGISSIKGLVDKARNTGMSALALTDHGNMDGAIRFYKQARKAGIKPIIGCELYFTRKPEVQDRAYTWHLTALAKNIEGYHNLMKLVSAANDHIYYKPRITPEILRKYSHGIIGMSACLGGEIPDAIMNLRRRSFAPGEWEEKAVEEAARLASWYADVFPDGFFLEIMNNGFDGQRDVNAILAKVEEKTGVLRVPTNDAHYLERDDGRIRHFISHMAARDPLSEEEGEEGLWLRTPEEMREIFSDDLCDRTLKIASMCDLEIDLGKHVFPVYSTPGMTAEEEIRKRAWDGLEARGLSGQTKYRERLEGELGQIVGNGFSTYLLIVADFIREAKRRGIAVGPGRGSAAGSLTCYALGITDLDPLPYNLLFERFINPERVSLPDIDVDFCQKRRGEMIQYMIDRYGEERVAQIANVNTMQARQAIRDIARAVGLVDSQKVVPMSDVKDMVRVIEKASDIKASDGQVIRTLIERGDFDEITRGRPLISEIIELASHAEGVPRNRGVHAAGIVVADTKITDYSPVWKGKDGAIITQYDKKDIEEAGLVKIDFLGLKNVTMIQMALQNIVDAGKEPVDILKIPLDDPKTFALYASGEMDGVFQMESDGMRKYLAQLAPKRFEDLIALLALYRPGPLNSGMIDDFVARSRGRAEVSYFGLDDMVKDFLEPTYGVIVYQEQVMQMARAVAGFSLGQADILRRAMGKKDPKEMASQRGNFVNGAMNNGVDREKAENLFDMIAKFAEYGFNKSHSAAYALISYQTAWLKANHPLEFWAALMEVEKDKVDKLGKYVRICRASGIKVETPDIFTSGREFYAKNGSISFGLDGLKGIPSRALEDLMAAQKKWKDKRPATMAELLGESPNFTAKFLEAMNKAGAFDSFVGPDRRDWIAFNSKALLKAAKKSESSSNRMTLLPMDDIVKDPLHVSGVSDPPPEKRWGIDERLAGEMEVAGFYISDSHPIEAFIPKGTVIAGRTLIADLLEKGGKGDLRALAKNLVIRTAKKGGNFLMGEIEDESGKLPFIAYAKTFAESGTLKNMKENNCYRLRGILKEDSYRSTEDHKAWQFVIDSADPVSPGMETPARLDLEAPRTLLMEKRKDGISLSSAARELVEIMERNMVNAPENGACGVFFYFSRKDNSLARREAIVDGVNFKAYVRHAPFMKEYDDWKQKWLPKTPMQGKYVVNMENDSFTPYEAIPAP